MVSVWCAVVVSSPPPCKRRSVTNLVASLYIRVAVAAAAVAVAAVDVAAVDVAVAVAGVPW